MYVKSDSKKWNWMLDVIDINECDFSEMQNSLISNNAIEKQVIQYKCQVSIFLAKFCDCVSNNTI